jgi:cell division protein FtsB
MNIEKAVKALVAENEALKAEIAVLKNSCCEKCALEEKVKKIYDEARELSSLVQVTCGLSKPHEGT